MPYCPFCGSETSDDDTFCRSCGAMLNGSSMPPQKPKDDSRTMKVIAVAVVIAILFAAVGGIIAYYAFDFSLKSEYNNTYKWECNGHKFSYEITVDSAYYHKATGSDIDRSGSISIERYTTDSGVTVAVKDYIVVDQYVKDLAESLKTQYTEAFGEAPTKEMYVKFVAVFIYNCIGYDWDEYKSGREYWRYPLQTLIEKTGDCEDESILMAAILDAAGYDSGIILLPGHAMCAVTSDEIPDLTYPNKKHSDIYSLDFYPVDTTDVVDNRIIGYMVEKYEDVYAHLYMGYVTDYY